MKCVATPSKSFQRYYKRLTPKQQEMYREEFVSWMKYYDRVFSRCGIRIDYDISMLEENTNKVNSKKKRGNNK